MIIREIKEKEIVLMSDFLYHTIYQKDPNNLAPKSIIQDHALQLYIDEFGTKRDDHCLVALVEEKIVAAVWVRCIRGYGYVGDNVPEFSIAVYPQYRGLGIGSKLMIEMLGYLGDKGYTQSSLAVSKDNYAVKMYQKIGFKIDRENEQEYVMTYKFAK